MIVAVVLSAGESSRMGRPKALLPIDGKPFIEHIVSILQLSRVEKIIVVLGHNAEKIREKIGHLPVSFVINKKYKKGQLSSLIAGLKELEVEGIAAKVDGALVHLVDHPFLSAALVNRMIDAFYKSKKLIILPRYKGKRGHPVLFSSELFHEFLRTPLELGAKAVVRAHPDETLEIDTEEEGITVDIDTPEEYHRRVGKR